MKYESVPLYLFFVQIIPTFAIGFSWSSVLKTIERSLLVSFFKYFTTFWCYMLLHINPVFFAPVLESAISPRKFDSFYWQNGIENWNLGAECAHLDGSASRTSQLTKQRSVCLCTNPLFTHRSINISLCKHLCLCWDKHEFTLCLRL